MQINTQQGKNNHDCISGYKNQSERALSIGANISFCIYLFLAIFFYRERLFADSAYFLFNIINNGEPFVTYNRFGSALTQVPVLIALKHGLTLDRLSIIYSASFVLFYYLIFFFIRYWLKEVNLAFLIVLLLSMGVAHTFYWPVDELAHGLAFCVLYFALLHSYYKFEGPKKYLIYFVLLVVFVTSLMHPVTALVAAYMTIFDLLLKRKILPLHITLFGLCVVYVIYKKISGSAYEANKMALSFSHINSVYLYHLLALFITKYIAHLLFIVLISTGYLLRKEYIKLIYVGISFLGFSTLVALIDKNPANWFYTEHLYLPLSVIVGLPFLADILPQARESLRLKYAAVLLISIGISFYLISSAGLDYGFRLKKMKHIANIEQLHEHSKFVVSRNNFYEKDLMKREIIEYWAYPAETLMQTAIDGDPKTVVFDRELKQSLPDLTMRYNRIALAPWHFIDHRHLRKDYFALDPGDYTKLNTNMNFKVITEEFIEKISIEFSEVPRSLKVDSDYYLDILVKNQNSVPLRSGLNQGNEIHISYHWQIDEDVVLWDGIRTPLEIDLYDSVSQKVSIRTPESPGCYRLVVDIVAENFRWFGIDEEISLVVVN